jgi:uncharacterized protein YbaA (DUF1428 family)
MSRYVDGYVAPVPKSTVEAYRKMAENAGAVWREHGALEYVECSADDVLPFDAKFWGGFSTLVEA